MGRILLLLHIHVCMYANDKCMCVAIFSRLFLIIIIRSPGTLYAECQQPAVREMLNGFEPNISPNFHYQISPRVKVAVGGVAVKLIFHSSESFVIVSNKCF